MKKVLSTLFSAVFTLSLFAQAPEGNWCRTDENLQKLQNADPSIIQNQQEMEEFILNYKENNPETEKKATIIIPVVFHVITNNGNGNVTKAQIEQAMTTVNQDFKRTNNDTSVTRDIFKPYAASMDIEFRLAHLDPNGECTEGIVRVESPLSTNASDAVKSVSYWDSKRYFNIWVVDIISGSNPPSYVAGYAQFPTSGINSTYGVVMDNDFLSGRTLTHEIGHCFNLYHTFQSGCGFNCQSSGDYCCDTPPVSTSSGACNYGENTCSNDQNGTSPFSSNMPDQIENYMSYNACQNMFSEDQKTRMMATLNNTSTSTGLYQLWNNGNNTLTGTADPYDPNPVCVPKGANFSYNKTYVCEGDQVTFQDEDTYNATPTMWDWTFEGGTPGVSNQEVPVITYNIEGVYDVTYSPGTSAGFAQPVSKTDIITVSSIVADYTLPFTEGFENTTTFNDDWEIVTDASAGWQNVNSAAYTGSRSVRVLNINNDINDITELISPSYDLSNMTEPVLSYKWAFARKSSGGNDQFIVYYSLDCGGTWTINSVQAGASMATGPSTNSSWTPSSTADWDEKVINLSSLAGNSNVRFKFRLKNNGGNNFYLDDINVDGNVGVKNNLLNKFELYPNPTNKGATLTFSLTENVSKLQIVVRDVLGKVVTNVVNGQAFNQGKYTMAIDQKGQLTSGLYFIEFNADGNVRTEKLIVK